MGAAKPQQAVLEQRLGLQLRHLTGDAESNMCSKVLSSGLHCTVHQVDSKSKARQGDSKATANGIFEQRSGLQSSCEIGAVETNTCSKLGSRGVHCTVHHNHRQQPTGAVRAHEHLSAHQQGFGQ